MHNYFNCPIKLFSDLYLIKFLGTLIKNLSVRKSVLHVYSSSINNRGIQNNFEKRSLYVSWRQNFSDLRMFPKIERRDVDSAIFQFRTAAAGSVAFRLKLYVAPSSPDGYCYFKLHRWRTFLKTLAGAFREARWERGTTRQYDNATVRFGELLRFIHFFALHFLSFPFHWMNLLTLLERPSLA